MYLWFKMRTSKPFRVALEFAYESIKSRRRKVSTCVSFKSVPSWQKSKIMKVRSGM